MSAVASSNITPGIDIGSTYGDIDFELVVKEGFKFVLIRATQGFDIDPNFRKNWDRADEAGLIRGAYHTLCAPVGGHDIISQARRFKETIAPVIGKGDILPALSLEISDRWNKFSKKDMLSAVLEFVIALQRRLGTPTTILRMNAQSAAKILPFDDILKSLPLWAVHHSGSIMRMQLKPMMPKPYDTWAFWQYSDAGYVPGLPIGGNATCGLDYFNGTVEELKSTLTLSGLNPGLVDHEV